MRKGQLICEITMPFEKFNKGIKALKAASSKIPLNTLIIHNLY